MNFIKKLFSGNMNVDAMLGICVHDPDIFLESPSNVKDTAMKSLGQLFKGYTLSPNAKVSYLISQGNLSFVESEKKASKDLPEQLKEYILNIGLKPEEYEFKYSSENLRDDIKVLWGIAIKN